MDNTVCFDIETIPDESKVDLLPVQYARGNLKDPSKIAADLEQKKQSQIGKMSLESNFGKICCVAFKDKDRTFSILDASEVKVLKETWLILQKYPFFVTFNGLLFDVPFLIKRSWLAGIRPTTKVDLARYRIGNHFDVRALLNNWDNMAKGKLDFYGQLKLGMAKGNDVDGSMVYALWQEGKFKEIQDHAESDVEITWKLFLSMQGYYF